ncbi:MAG: hypothetical protein WCK25_05005 [Actinomycetes bacterium]
MTAPETSPQKKPMPRFAARLLSLPTPAHVAIVLLVSLAKYGVDRYPSIDLMRALATNWSNPHASPLLLPPDDYRLASPVSALLAALLHCTSVRSFLAFHLLLALLAVVSPFALKRVRTSPELRSLVTLIMVGSAVPAVLFGWVGGYDAVTVAAISVAVLSEHRALSAIGWLFAALNNAPLAILAFLVVAGHRVMVDRQRSVTPLAIHAGGLLAGVVLVQLLLRHWGVTTSRLGVYNDLYEFSRFTTSFSHFAPLIIIGGFGAGWFLLGAREVRTLPGGTMALSLAAGCCVVIPLIALDQTRVLSLVGFALVLSVAKVAERSLAKATVHQVIHRMLPVAALLIIPVVWDNQLLYAGWSNLRAVLSFIVLGH